MDVAAAIRAQTNQLEMQQRKKKKQHSNNPTSENNNQHRSNNYPPKSRSFHDERNQFNPYAQQSPFPHYVNSEYPFENKDIDCEDADSITSSLSGTLPGTTDNLLLSPTRELQKLDTLKATVKAELDELRSANSNTNSQSANNQNHREEGARQQQQQQPRRQSTSKSLPPPRNRNHYGGSNNTGIVNLSATKSVGSTGTRERITPGGNIIVMDTESENEDDRGGDNNYDVGSDVVVSRSLHQPNNNKNNNTGNSNNSKTPTKTNRIEEIMSAYQGKVETILKKRGEEHSSFQTLIEKNQHSDTVNLAAPSTSAASGGGGGASMTSTSTPNSGIENILDTYKKKVDEIMNTPTRPMPSSVMSASSSVASYGKLQQQPSLAVDFDRIADDDEEASFVREGGVDNSRGDDDDDDDDDDRSYDSRGSYSSHSSGSSRSSYDSGSESSRSGVDEGGNGGPPNPPKRQESFSERANAILNSINSPNNVGENAGVGGRKSLHESSNDDDEGSDDNDSHISGASSASEKSGLASLRSQDHKNLSTLPFGKDNNKATTTNFTAGKVPSSSSKSSSFGRKDSLTRAQEITGLSPKKSKSLHHDWPTTAHRSEIEEERLYRMELERRLAEATQREDELTRENRRLEKNLSEVQSQLDEMNSEARSNKYSSSEQTSKIRELERKLKNEKERSEELERERDAIKEEYDQDLEEQKDINRQLEQMVMSEEFEKELEDEINQVKELEHANRRFKVKVDMLEREKNAIMKRYDGKMEDSANKIKSLEEQLKEWEGKVGGLETSNREMENKWEAKLDEEKRYARELKFDLEKAEDKIKVLDAELVELRDSNSKIEEYEQVLGKLMERNEELEEEAQTVVGEKEMMDRRIELEEKRNALRVRELEQKIEEQQEYIEQQQETLDESVKTILKMYSLNNGRGDDMSTMSEEQLTGIARSIVPRASGRNALPTARDDVLSTPAGSTHAVSSVLARRRDSNIATSGRGRPTNALTDDVETLMLESESRVRARSRGRAQQQQQMGESNIDRPIGRARSRGRPAPRQEDEFDDVRARARSKSRGRGDRTESMRQLTERARTPGRTRSRSPVGNRRDRDYDPSGPISDSRALVLASPNDSGRKYGGQYDIPQSSGPRQNSRRESNYDGPPRHDAPRSGARPDRHAHQQQRRMHHDEGYRGGSNPRRGDRGERDGDRRRPGGGGGGGGDHYRRRGSVEHPENRGYRNKNYSHNDDHYTPRRVPMEPSAVDDGDGQDRQLRVMSDGDDGRQRSGSSNNRRRSSRRYHPRDRDRD